MSVRPDGRRWADVSFGTGLVVARCAGGVGGVEVDAEEAGVVGAVVGPAQGDEVGGVGGSAVFPVPDVVDLQAGGPATAGDAASAVSVFDEAA